jgi:hypothetical protein
LILVALLFAMVLLAGLGGYASIIFGTVARGKAIPQELLVSRVTADE